MIAGGAEWRSVQLAAFTAYFDASGDEHNQPCLAVAGFVATADLWVDFENAWNAVLSVFDLAYFHAREINYSPEWDTERRKDLYVRLIETIRFNTNRKFGHVVINENINQQWSKEERLTWNVRAYSLAGRACAGQLRTWCACERMPRLPEIIFESGDLGAGDLTEMMRRDGFPDPIFKPKRDRMKNGFLEKGAVPLQAADLLAFECFDPVRKILNDGHLKRMRPSLGALDAILGEPTWMVSV